MKPDKELNTELDTELNIQSINFSLGDLRTPVIVIIGPPGSGKTTVGTALAKKLNWHFYDTDFLIEQATSMKIAEIFSKYQETAFRKLENALVNQMTSICQKDSANNKSIAGTIISCGGGLPIHPQNFSNLSTLGKIICLNAPSSVLMDRIAHLKYRPLLNPSSSSSTIDKRRTPDESEQLSRLEKLLAQRKEVYAKAPYQVDTSNKNIEAVVATISTLLQL